MVGERFKEIFDDCEKMSGIIKVEEWHLVVYTSIQVLQIYKNIIFCIIQMI